jgi:hypothetical protein
MWKIRYQRMLIAAAVLILLTQASFLVPDSCAQNPPVEKVPFIDTNPEGVPDGLSPEEWDQILNQVGTSYEQQAYLKASNTDAFDQFGYSLAIWGDTIVVGTPYEASDGSGEENNDLALSGAVYVFVREGSTWTQQAYLKAGYPDEWDLFGYSVDISGDTIVGASGEESDGSGEENDDLSNAGAAFVFVREGTTWTQQAYLKASNVESYDAFGCSVAISGDRIVVGAKGEDSDGSGEENNDAGVSGAVYVFERDGSTWTQQAYLKASNVGVNDEFGESVAISWSTVVVGARGEDSDGTGEANNGASWAGAAYVFVDNGSGWTQQAYLKASNADADDNFGNFVAITLETIVIGARCEGSDGSNPEDNSAECAGAAYVFERSGTIWTQQAYLKASNVEAGDTIVVGAWTEDGDGSGEEDNSSEDSGAAYVFSRSESVWSQIAYLKAANVDAEDAFGVPVAIFGNTVVVGAQAEDSDGTGQDNNDANTAGAVYVFHKNEQPIADAGPDQSVNTLSQVQLDGSASSDPDGNTPLTYHWWQEWGTAVSLIGDDTAAPNFIAPADPVTLVFNLVVTDSLGLSSEPDLVVIEVQGYKLYLPMIIN